MRRLWKILLITFCVVLCIGVAACNDDGKMDNYAAKDEFAYDPTANQDGYIITGVQKEDGDGVLDIPETIDGKSVVGIVSLHDTASDGESSHYTKIKKLIIPKTVKEAYAYACKDMVGLREVVFAENAQIEKISEGLFFGCVNLKTLRLPDSVTEIHASAFENCLGLTELYLPQNVYGVGASAFLGSGIETLTIHEENNDFCAVDNILYNKDKTQLVYYPAQKKDIAFTVLDTVTEILPQAFYGCKALETVDLKNVETIRKYAFAECENLETITAEFLQFAEENIASDTAWWQNDRSGEIRLGQVLLSYTGSTVKLDITGCVSIAPYAFKGNKAILEITFDETLVNIGDGAFADCRNLFTVKFHNRARMVFIGRNAFENNASNLTIQIYEPLYDEYAENVFWQPYAAILQTYK